MSLNTQHRRTLIHELQAEHSTPAALATALAARGVTNPRTGKPYTTRTIVNDMKAQSASVPVREMIGRGTVESFWGQLNYNAFTYDATRQDYRFYDKLRRCQADGYFLSGLLCEPITSITTDWMFAGGSPTLAVQRPQQAKPAADLPTDDPYDHTDDVLRRWVNRYRALLKMIAADKLALGDQYVVVNTDGTLTAVSPETVTPLHDPENMSRVIGYKIEAKQKRTTVTTIYTPDKRVVTVKTPQGETTEEHSNLIGKLPVVHFANNRSANELFGRSVFEPLAPVLGYFDDLLRKALGGAMLLSNPIPVLENLEDPLATYEVIKTISEDNYTDERGNSADRKTVAVDKFPWMLLGKGGRAAMLSPQVGFTSDITKMIDMLFELVLRNRRIPRRLWGGADAGSKADSDAQMPSFNHFIEACRLEYEGEGADDVLGVDARGGLLELADIFLRYRALADKKIVVAPLEARWSALSHEEENIRLQKIIYANSQGALRRETMLDQMHLVSDARSEVAKARKELATMPPPVSDDEARLNLAAHQAVNPPIDPNAPAAPALKENPAGGEPAAQRLQPNGAKA